MICALVAISAAGAVFVEKALADGSETYKTGYVAPMQGGDSAYDDGCIGRRDSSAYGPGGYYMTVALINTSGGWQRSARGNGFSVATFISPDTASQAYSWLKKAHCNNSDNINTFNIECDDDYYGPNPGQHCV